MTIGIYSLKFEGTNKVYIGQSINIEKRYQQHINSFKNNNATDKLQNAYNLFGTPFLEILVECVIQELNELEIEAINIFDSVNKGFNTYSSPYQAPITKYGEESGNSLYSNDQIVKVFLLLISEKYCTAVEISEITKVSTHVVSQISCGGLHRWLESTYPKEYKILQNKKHNRHRGAIDVVSQKLGASNQGIKYPLIKSPDGTIFEIDNAYRFAKERGLAGNHFQEVLNGHRQSHKGWRVWEQPEQVS